MLPRLLKGGHIIMKKLFIYSFVTLFLAFLFIIKPDVDISFSREFYSQNTQKFIFYDNKIISIVEQSAYLFAFVFFCFHAKCLLSKQKQILNLQKLFSGPDYQEHKHALLLLCFGPIFTVQMFCKNLFGRSRPEKILEFGGVKVFTPAFIMTNECFFDCSFISFHTAVATMLFLHARNFYSGKAKYINSRITFSLIFIYAVIRIGQGKHFLSDIIFSICFICIIDAFIIMKRRQTMLLFK